MRGDIIVDKKQLIPGKTYLYKRKTVIDGVEREAERYMICTEITRDGGWFKRYFEDPIFLDNTKIKEDLYV